MKYILCLMHCRLPYYGTTRTSYSRQQVAYILSHCTFLLSHWTARVRLFIPLENDFCFSNIFLGTLSINFPSIHSNLMTSHTNEIDQSDERTIPTHENTKLCVLNPKCERLVDSFRRMEEWKKEKEGERASAWVERKWNVLSVKCDTRLHFWLWHELSLPSPLL